MRGQYCPSNLSRENSRNKTAELCSDVIREFSRMLRD
jgi:hypothetical protein